MIPNNAIQRVFQIQVNNSTGTCFTVEHKNKQYIVTAKHIVAEIEEKTTIEIFHNKQWKTIEVQLVGFADNPIDIAVLTTDIQISPLYPLPATAKGSVYGQDVYFLGFPYGLYEHVGEMNNNFPLPFVKKATLSSMSLTDEIQIYYLDGHNNPGFSGGPVVFKEPYPTEKDFKILGVISGYRFESKPIHDEDKTLPYYVKENSGIIISYGIKHATDIIEQNPIGFELPPQSF
ncbi:serine protease [Maridesulfovibrio sp.]|uniref:S1 family peptidase n=1 Tax=Maridesulfovibrio sp. TaxID=2795000 RepID=UPI0029F4EA89|nr:serine protease [Maridesulfovibrio sp.]